jgi:hypothetical protein
MDPAHYISQTIDFKEQSSDIVKLVDKNLIYGSPIFKYLR